MSTRKQDDYFDPGKRRITVCAKRFAAALQFISQEPTRYYLNGVFIEPHKDGGVTMTATNGHILASVRDTKALIEGKQGWICPIPKHPFLTMLRQRNAGHLHFVGDSVYLTDSMLAYCDVVDPEFDPSYILPRHMAVGYSRAIDGTYPNWRDLLPRKGRSKASDFALNGKLIEPFTKAIKIINPASAPELNFFTPESDSVPIVVRSGSAPDFFGLQMPMRKTECSRLPAWLSLSHKRTNKPRKPANDATPSKTVKANAA